MKQLIFGAILIAIIMNCSGSKLVDGRYYLDKYNDKTILVGQVTAAEIWRNIPDWKEAFDHAEIDSNVVEKLSKIDTPTEIKIILGIWCSDSEEGVPPFLRNLIASANPNFALTMYAVNRSMESPQNIAAHFKVDRVPTFIVLRENQEIARMVEIPKEDFSRDLIDLLSAVQ